jgi:hypothetical protein
LILTPLKQSNQAELINYIYAETQSYEASDYASKSALTQARKKLDKALFVDMNKMLAKTGSSMLKEKLYKGYRLLAVDGTKLYLPASPELKKVYGTVHNQYSEQCLPVCSLLVDVLNGWMYNGILGTSKTSEKELLFKLLDSIPPNSILLLDRLYPSTELVYELNKRGIKFVIRCSLSWNNEVKKLHASTNESERIVKEALSCRAKRNMKTRGQETIEAEASYRLVKLKRKPHEVEKIKSVLEKGQKFREAKKVEETVILMTSLDESEATSQELMSLYSYRWGVETDINTLKNKLTVELLSSKSSACVAQDFYATLCRFNISKFLYNVASEKLEEQCKLKPTKHKRKINMSLTITLAIKGLKIQYSSPDGLEQYEKLACDLLLRFTEASRPNRHEPRQFKANKQRGRIRHDPNFKRVA